MIDNGRQWDDDGGQDKPPNSGEMHGSQKAPGGANARGDPDRPGAPPKDDRLPAYERWTRERLYAHARTVGIKRRSSMNKQQLIDALRERCR